MFVTRYPNETLEKMFDLSHAQADQKIKVDEDRELLMLQKQVRIGSLAAVDRKLEERKMIIGKKDARETAYSISCSHH